jgi:hypothetical protein
MSKNRRQRRHQQRMSHQNGAAASNGSPLPGGYLNIAVTPDFEHAGLDLDDRDRLGLVRLFGETGSHDVSDRKQWRDGAAADADAAGCPGPSHPDRSPGPEVAPEAFARTPSSPQDSAAGSASPPAELASVPEHSRLEPPCAFQQCGDGDAAPKLDDSSRNNVSSSSILMRLAGAARVFRGSDGRSYAEVPSSGHHEIHELGSSAFEYWLIRTFRDQHKALPPADGINRLVRALHAEAAQRPATEPVWVRVAQANGSPAPPRDSASAVSVPGASQPDLETVYYVDLGDSTWEAVEIRSTGCRVVSRPPVSFRRPKNMRSLPRPRWDGSIDLLRKFVNLGDDDFPLLVAWMTAALCPVGPYPVLILCGEHGSAKSTMARVVRRLIDPSAALLRALPGSHRDLMVEAHNTWLLAYDNISSIPPALSDAVCRVATGGGLSTRALHSNDGESLLDVLRPTIFTGIDDFVRRGDLIDRSIFLQLPSISESGRRLEKVFWAEFEADYPRILGSLLLAVAGGLRMLPRVQLPALPRMADFAQWGEAVSVALGWQPGSFLAQCLANRRRAYAVALEELPIVEALRCLVEVHKYGPDRAGAPSQILEELGYFVNDQTRRSAQWPKNASSFSNQLRRIAPQLRAIGINVEFDRQRTGRLIRISPVVEASPVEPEEEDRNWPPRYRRVTPRMTAGAQVIST